MIEQRQHVPQFFLGRFVHIVEHCLGEPEVRSGIFHPLQLLTFQHFRTVWNARIEQACHQLYEYRQPFLLCKSFQLQPLQRIVFNDLVVLSNGAIVDDGATCS